MVDCHVFRYDYTSSHVGAGVGEQITVTANMRRYCTACTVYLAVYGFPGIFPYQPLTPLKSIIINVKLTSWYIVSTVYL